MTHVEELHRELIQAPEHLMNTTEVLHAWSGILAGRRPSLSIEITKECPLRCPGCYAFDPARLGGDTELRQLSDFKGADLVKNVLAMVETSGQTKRTLAMCYPLNLNSPRRVFAPCDRKRWRPCREQDPPRLRDGLLFVCHQVSKPNLFHSFAARLKSGPDTKHRSLSRGTAVCFASSHADSEGRPLRRAAER
jgi:hypothetical protein